MIPSVGPSSLPRIFFSADIAADATALFHLAYWLAQYFQALAMSENVKFVKREL